MKLGSLIEFVGRRLKALNVAATRVAALPTHDFEKERLATFLTIDLYNLNVEWIRLYYLSVSTNQALRKNGRKIIIGHKQQSNQDAVSYAIWRLNGADARSKWLAGPTRFHEPSWVSVNTLPQLAVALNFPDRIAIGTS